MKKIQFALPVLALIFAVVSAFGVRNTKSLTVDLKSTGGACSQNQTIADLPFTDCAITNNGAICTATDGSEIHEAGSACSNPYQRQ